MAVAATAPVSALIVPVSALTEMTAAGSAGTASAGGLGETVSGTPRLAAEDRVGEVSPGRAKAETGPGVPRGARGRAHGPCAERGAWGGAKLQA